jgi:hypothetical protein
VEPGNGRFDAIDPLQEPVEDAEYVTLGLITTRSTCSISAL